MNGDRGLGSMEARMERFFINRRNSILLVIDLQERFLPHIEGSGELIKKTGLLVEATKKLGIPILLTEQYPKGLGHTVKDVLDKLKVNAPIEKDTFSCCGEKRFVEAIKSSGRTHVIVCGIESHVCVLQTALDLMDMGYSVHLPQDAVSSRHPSDRESAISMMRDAGAVITCTESLLFQLLERSGTEEFKEIQKLVK